MAYRHTASFGKRQEFVAIAELLRRGYDVYLTLVDDQGIDCIVRREISGQPVYLDIQIKARSKQAKPNNAARFSLLDIQKPRPNYYFIFYSEQACAYWIVPSQQLVKLANRHKTGENAGKYSTFFTNVSRRTGEVRPRPKFDAYRDNFDVLKQYTG